MNENNRPMRMDFFLYNHVVGNIDDISSHTKKTINTVDKTYDHV